MVSDPYDESQIGATDNIIRRINPMQHVVWDENRNRNRVSSKLYSPSSEANGGMSVDLERLIFDAGYDPKVYVTTPAFIGSVVFTAASVRRVGLWVGYDPLPENPYHGEVWGTPRANRFSDRQKRELGAVANWYVELPDVDIF